MWHVILPILLLLTSVFLILLVLIQRGRGGGLAGAFGGLGGQSAFGTKAGDLFTRITIGVATFWIILCAGSVKLLNDTGSSLISPKLGGGATAPVQPGGAAKNTTTLPGAAKGGTTAPASSESAAPGPASNTPAGGAKPETSK
jgi:preprotein translocase subunit SecG